MGVEFVGEREREKAGWLALKGVLDGSLLRDKDRELKSEAEWSE